MLCRNQGPHELVHPTGWAQERGEGMPALGGGWGGSWLGNLASSLSSMQDCSSLSRAGYWADRGTRGAAGDPGILAHTPGSPAGFQSASYGSVASVRSEVTMLLAGLGAQGPCPKIFQCLPGVNLCVRCSQWLRLRLGVGGDTQPVPLISWCRDRRGAGHPMLAWHLLISGSKVKSTQTPKEENRINTEANLDAWLRATLQWGACN